MAKKSSIYIGPIAVGYLLKAARSEFEERIQGRMWTPLADDATFHWVPKGPCSSPTLTTIARYDDGSTGSYVLDTSSEAEIVLFEADFKDEIEILRENFERVEIIFAVISY
ncbi:MAG: hypothetical protein EOP06_18335 [Proteobacteria bacterium]|nr:MAG: hypothetical protein EOP06_18335 [Pseudomonadota bacterium]